MHKLVLLIIISAVYRVTETAVYDTPSSCPSGTKLFELPDGSIGCLFCTVCPAGQVEKKPCSDDSDTVCECEGNTFYNTTASRCMKCTVCLPGQYVTRACTHAANAACATCPQGSDTTVQNSECCQPHRNCSEDGGDQTDCPKGSPALCKTNDTLINSVDDQFITNSGAGDNNRRLSTPIVVILVLLAMILMVSVILAVVFARRYPKQERWQRLIRTPCCWVCASYGLFKSRNRSPSPQVDDLEIQNLCLSSDPPDESAKVSFMSEEKKSGLLLDSAADTNQSAQESHLLVVPSSIPSSAGSSLNEDDKFLNSLKECEKSVGALVYGHKVLTVFRVGKNLAMTSYSAYQKMVAGSDDENVLRSARVTFKKHPAVENHADLMLYSSIFYKDMLNDIIVLKFEQLENLPAPLTLWNGDIPDESEFGFVEYMDYHSSKRHISSGFLSLPDSLEFRNTEYYIKRERSEIENILDRSGKDKGLVEEALKDFQNESQVLLRRRDLPGGKGSPCFINNNGRADVAVLYSHTVPLFYEELPLKRNYRGRLYLTGPRMSEVYKELKSNKPQLAKEIFGT